MASLFSACKSAIRNNGGGTFNIGGYDIDIEYYGQQDIDDDFRFGNVAFGDEDESKILLVAGSTITIPEGYTLTPDSPKKSLVIFCNNLVNNGTISMYQKAPNVLPHDYFIIEKTYFDSNKDLVIPAYADNGVDFTGNLNTNAMNGYAGINGTNRKCGSGGLGTVYDGGDWGDQLALRSDQGGTLSSGSGYAFGGGAGTGGIFISGLGWENIKAGRAIASVDSTYTMHGGTTANYTSSSGYVNGIGNPKGNQNNDQFGCGGRIIIFCINFVNNGTINVNGTNQINANNIYAYGGCSGAGAVDLFYTNLNEQGVLIANGGSGKYSCMKGGDGSITLSQWSQTKLFKTEVKYFSQANVAYLLTQLSDRIKDSRMGE